MGGRPLCALNIMGIPEQLVRPETIAQILRGGASKAKQAGCAIIGGHTIRNPEPIYGLAVTGLVRPNHMLTNARARPGDLLVLTKPLGTGIATTAIKRGLASPALEKAIALMCRLNSVGADLAEKGLVRAAVDVTGFGLLGHLASMCRASGVGAEVRGNDVPALSPAILNLIKNGCVRAGRNRISRPRTPSPNGTARLTNAASSSAMRKRAVACFSACNRCAGRPCSASCARITPPAPRSLAGLSARRRRAMHRVNTHRGIPSVEKVIHSLGEVALPRPLVVALVRRELAAFRKAERAVEFDALIQQLRVAIDDLRLTRIQPVINATGVVIHTNLGRAPLPVVAVAAMQEVAASYNNLELDLVSGARGKRATYHRAKSRAHLRSGSGHRPEQLCRRTRPHPAPLHEKEAGSNHLARRTDSDRRQVSHS